MTGETGRVVDVRLERLEERVKQLEHRADVAQLNHSQILVELRVLQTRVGFLAAVIGTLSGLGSSLGVAAARFALGG